VTDIVGAGDAALRLTGLDPLARLASLMRGQFHRERIALLPWSRFGLREGLTQVKACACTVKS